MKEIEFNLLDEPWIRVRDDSCQVHEVSLTDALLHAHQYTSLSGELPTQDIVILRLMLAVLHTVFPESMRTAMRQNWKTKKKRLRGGQIFGNLVSFRRNRFANIWKNGMNGSGCFIRKDLLDRWQGWIHGYMT